MTANVPPGVAEPSDWTKAIVDPAEFAREREQLGHFWTFLGLTRDLAKDGDWFRSTLGGKSVFVQRFKDNLKGFENRCVHRNMPLRTQDKGNGKIVCGFHHWMYNQAGRAIGIPHCLEVYGKIPRELDARLTPIEVATCGTYVFGRFAAPGQKDTLEQYLGEFFPVVAAMSQMPQEPSYFEKPAATNWRLGYHITLDDYHAVAVHPSTFGKLGYQDRRKMVYHREGLHSAFLSTNNPDEMTKMIAECRAGTFRSQKYRIVHIFPDMFITHLRSDSQHWHIILQQYQPVAHDRTLLRIWVNPAPFPADHPWYERFTGPFTNPVRKHIVNHFVNKVIDEDNVVCERIQQIAGQIKETPIFGTLEERIVWFEDSYRKAMATRWAERPPRPAPAAPRPKAKAKAGEAAAKPAPETQANAGETAA
jgi:phenylpropionate dioxygenase-like ring-hydroxylating dioxygenase large terminal subunit